jgi:hypothetical protein
MLCPSQQIHVITSPYLMYATNMENHINLESPRHGFLRIGSEKLKITHNLVQALLRLRKSPKTWHYRFWVDAICIDQSSPHEKTLQVRQMFTLYSRAHTVLVWLGERGLEEGLVASHFRRQNKPWKEA